MERKSNGRMHRHIRIVSTDMRKDGEVRGKKMRRKFEEEKEEEAGSEIL